MGTKSFRTGVAAASLVFALTAGTRCAWADDLAIVRQRMIDDLLSSTPSASTVNNYRSDLATNGSWSDIDYASTSKVGWEPLTHLTRLTAMAEAYSSSSHSLYQNAGLRTDILKAYNYWIARDPQSANWFYNELSAPQELGNAMVLINGILSSSQRSAGLDVLERAYKSRNDTSTNTGMNRVERALAGIARGIVAGSNSIAADAFAAIGDTLVISSGEGIKRDGSFHQHGKQLYNSGYGSEFVTGSVKALELNAGTGFAFSDAKQHVLVDHLLDGTQWMIRGEVIDYTASGRNITRKGQDDNASALAGQLKTILGAVDGYRSDEIQAFRSRVQSADASGSTDPSLVLVGNKQFWQSDFMAHHRANFYASVKTSSTRTVQPETGNNEGLKSLYLGDGVNLIMRTGNEYDNIMPVWNWRRLPGTTVEQDSRSLEQSVDFGVAGTSSYAGGVSDGTYGASAFHYDRFNVEAKKSWFFFDDEFVALGAAINAPDSVHNVNTTLNQALLKGTVSYKTNASLDRKTIALGDTITPSGLQWVFHDGVGYFFPTPADNAVLRAITQTGTWEAINERYDDTSVGKDVFTLYLNHGNEFTDGSYNYIVVPGLTVGQMDGYMAENPIDVLRNTASVQAIHQSKLDVTQAVFYSVASLSLGDGQSFAVSDPSTVIMRRPDDTLQFTASSPESKSPNLSIDLTAIKFATDGSSWMDGFSKSSTLVLGLPDDDRAGASVGIAISTDGAAKPTVRFTTFDQPTTFSYTSDAALALPADTTLYAGSNKTLMFKGTITGNASLTKSGESTLNLSGPNAYTDGTYVLGGSVSVTGDQRGAEGGWIIGPDNALETTVTFQPGSRACVMAGKQFRIGADSPTGTKKQQLNAAGLLSNYGSLSLGRYANVQVTGNWLQAGDMSIAGKGDVEYSPVLVVHDGGSFTYTGTSTIKVNPAPSSSANASLIIGASDGGGTFITGRGFERTIHTGSGISIVTLQYGGKLMLSADVAELTRGAFRFNLGNEGGVIDTNGFNAGLASSITNITGSTAGLTKSGAGTLELFKEGTYRGDTTVVGGALKVSNTTGSATGTGAVIIEASGILTGNGTISGDVSIKNGATIAPGNSPGTLATGGQTWGAGGRYIFEIASIDQSRVTQQSTKGIAGGADWLDIDGRLNITANATNTFHIDVRGLGQADALGAVSNWTPSQNYTWILASATDGISGFASDRFSIDVSAFITENVVVGTWRIGRDGNDLLLIYTTSVAVPEPSSVAAIASMLGALAYRRRGT